MYGSLKAEYLAWLKAGDVTREDWLREAVLLTRRQRQGPLEPGEIKETFYPRASKKEFSLPTL